MGGEPTRTHAQAGKPDSGGSHDWYVVTDGGASFRITSGLVLGEDDGTLVLNDLEAAFQWVEIVITDQGEPLLNVVNRGKSLRVADETCLQHRLEVGATLKLPNGELYISRNIYTPELSECVIEVLDREVPHQLQDLMGPGWQEALAQVQSRAAEAESEVAAAEPAPATGRQMRPDDPLRMTETRPRRAQTAPSEARQRQTTVMVGVLGLGAGALIGAIAVLMSTGGSPSSPTGNLEADPIVSTPMNPRSATPDPRGTSRIDDPLVAASTAPAGADARVTDGEPAAGPGGAAALEPPPAGGAPDSGATPRVDVALIPDTLVTGSAASTAAGGSPVSSSGADQTSAPAPPAPANTQPPARTAAGPAATAAATGAAGAGSAPAAGSTPAAGSADPQPDPALLAELEEARLMTQAMATELATRRDLAAADLALAEGRLSTPPETSAYTLYNRVLAADPGSPEATSGLQQVRQRLINRALAQLAGGNLSDARQTLQDAADAGADPALVANLSNEVDYRQQQMSRRVE